MSQEVVEDMELDSAQVCQLFGVTMMTLYNWRNGVRTTREKIPFYTEPRGLHRTSIKFNYRRIMQWAIENRVTNSSGDMITQITPLTVTES